ncbi:MAG: hypothetical protein HY017_05920 [Betaproteobacteria bacterium]|nr:hypothetical protein [Betaproteobacteria bacterium]
MIAQGKPDEQAAASRDTRAGGDWEFLWRFLAVAMLFSVAWVGWIAYQISASPIALPAAFEAVAKARPGHGRNAEGQIKGAAPETAMREPPVNADKLKFSESIETPIPDRAAKGAKRRER